MTARRQINLPEELCASAEPPFGARFWSPGVVPGVCVCEIWDTSNWLIEDADSNHC